MPHFTLHGRAGTTVTCSFTSAGFDAVAWSGQERSSLIDECSDPHSLWQASCWMVGQLGCGTDDDVGDALALLLAGGSVATMGEARLEIVALVQKLLEVSR